MRRHRVRFGALNYTRASTEDTHAPRRFAHSSTTSAFARRRGQPGAVWATAGGTRTGRRRRDELRDAADEIELPETLDERSLGSGPAKQLRPPLDPSSAQLEPTTLRERRRMRQDAHRRTRQTQRHPTRRGERRADRPRRVGAAEQFQRAVMREDRIGAHRKRDEEGIRHERLDARPWRNDRVDPTCDGADPAPLEVVLEPVPDGLGFARAEDCAGLLQREHRMTRQEGVES